MRTMPDFPDNHGDDKGDITNQDNAKDDQDCLQHNDNGKNRTILMMTASKLMIVQKNIKTGKEEKYGQRSKNRG